MAPNFLVKVNLQEFKVESPIPNPTSHHSVARKLIFVANCQWPAWCILICFILCLPGCSKKTEEAPVLKEIQKAALLPPEMATNIAGSLSVDGKPASDEVLEFQPQAKVNLKIEARSTDNSFRETAAIVKCVRIRPNGKTLVGSSAATNIPINNFEFEVPGISGEWELRVVTSENKLIYSQKIEVVQ